MAGIAHVFPDIQKHEASCSIGALAVSLVETGLAKESRLLVSGNSRNLHIVAQQGSLPVNLGR